MKRKVINPKLLRAAARRNIELGRVFASTLTEERRVSKNSSAYKRFDIFLCHARIDNDLVVAFKQILEQQGLTVYVDWIVDKSSREEGVTEENAKLLKSRMRNCDKLIYLHSFGAANSKWCPWEIGLFDALKSEVYVAMLAEKEKSTTGQEYLDLYPRFYFDNGSFQRGNFKYETERGYNAF